MNKKLVALAVAGAFALPLAAQAQTANVTLYGRLNLDLEVIKGRQADGSNPTVLRESSNSSRLGVRGTESLGGGLSAIFQIESSINGDTNAGNLGGRDTFVGLQGSWGRFTAGRYLAPFDDTLAVWTNNPTLQTSILEPVAIYANAPFSKGAGGFDDRLGNSVRYDSPNFAGLTTGWQFSTRDSSGNADSASNGDHASELRHAWVASGNLIYANGPLQLAWGGEYNRKVRGADLNDYDTAVSAAYDFGTLFQGFGLRLAAVFEHIKYETPTGDLKRNFWGISGTIPLGGGKIYAFYGQGNDGYGGAADGTAIGGLVKGADTGSKQWEVSYSYSLSPRTLLYTGYVKVNNECNAKYSFQINPYTINTAHSPLTTTDIPCNGSPGGFLVGMVHFF